MIKNLLNILLAYIKKEIKPNDLEACFDNWKKYRSDLISQKLELEKQIDKTVFTTSSGAIGISLILLDKVVPAREYLSLYYIIGVGWIFLVISLIYQILSFVNSSRLIKSSIEKVEEITKCRTIDEVVIKEDGYYTDWRSKNKKIDKRNRYSFFCMIAGIICIVSFAFASLLLKKENTPQKINLILSDSSINKIYIMSKENKGSDSSNKSSNSGKVNQPKTVKVITEGKLTVRQAQQIVAPPIKTNPKK